MIHTILVVVSSFFALSLAKNFESESGAADRKPPPVKLSRATEPAVQGAKNELSRCCRD